MTEAERRVALEQVAAEVRGCTRCRLHEGRTSAVPGEGHPSTEVMLVGEAPGLNEDRQGRPFVGAAGGFLTELLGTVGWARDEVFITNVVKCRPPGNRDPEPDEIAACAPFLRRQVEILDPALVITLGRHSMGRFMPGARIGQVHGTTASPPPETGASEALVFAMYHPAAALHQGSLRQTLLDDMTGAPRALLEARRLREEAGARPSEAVADAELAGEAEAVAEVERGPEPGVVGSPAGPDEGVSASGSAEEDAAAFDRSPGATALLRPVAVEDAAAVVEPAAPPMIVADATPASHADVPLPDASPPLEPTALPAAVVAPHVAVPPAAVDPGLDVASPALVAGPDVPGADQMTLF